MDIAKRLKSRRRQIGRSDGAPFPRVVSFLAFHIFPQSSKMNLFARFLTVRRFLFAHLSVVPTSLSLHSRTRLTSPPFPLWNQRWVWYEYRPSWLLSAQPVRIYFTSSDETLWNWRSKPNGRHYRKTESELLIAWILKSRNQGHTLGTGIWIPMLRGMPPGQECIQNFWSGISPEILSVGVEQETAKFWADPTPCRDIGR